MLNEIFNFTNENLEKSIVALKNEFSKFVVNRANLKLIEEIKITYYNDIYPLTQLAVILLDSANIVLVKPFDKKNLQIIYKEIIKLDLDLSPFISGDILKIVFPKITMERREFFVKKIKLYGENIKISVRNIRRQANQKIKNCSKNGDISKNEEKKTLIDIQVLIDKHIKIINDLTIKKEKDLLKS